MSKDLMRAEALRMAVQTCGNSHWHNVLEAAREFYQYLANEEESITERMMRSRTDV